MVSVTHQGFVVWDVGRHEVYMLSGKENATWNAIGSGTCLCGGESIA